MRHKLVYGWRGKIYPTARIFQAEQEHFRLRLSGVLQKVAPTQTAVGAIRSIRPILKKICVNLRHLRMKASFSPP
jgi:hypothetical protein